MTADELRRVLRYTKTTGEFYWRVPLSDRTPVGARAGTTNSERYRHIRIHGTIYKAHRLAWLYVTGVWPTHQIDHRNNIRSDNRWTNLREATPAQNSQNTPKRKRTGLKGTHYHPTSGRWQALIRANGKKYSLKYHDTEEQAHAAYCKAARQLHGKFSRVN